MFCRRRNGRSAPMRRDTRSLRARHAGSARGRGTSRSRNEGLGIGRRSRACWMTTSKILLRAQRTTGAQIIPICLVMSKPRPKMIVTTKNLLLLTRFKGDNVKRPQKHRKGKNPILSWSPAKTVAGLSQPHSQDVLDCTCPRTGA